MSKYILALDQGTTSTRAILFDENGVAAFKAQKELTQYYPLSGWVEHDPEEIFSSSVEVIRSVLSQANITAASVAAMGITNQRETTVLWEKDSGKPVYNAIVWQCRRTAGYMEKLKNAGKAELMYEKTGLAPDAYFSASKIKWLLDSVPSARERAEKGELLAGTVDSYLLYRLTGGKVHATDRTNTSRTLLYNIHNLDWDEELCSLFTVPACILPNVYPSGHLFGLTEPSLFGESINICSLVGDQQSALFGQQCWEKGESKNTYGTGSFLLMNTGSTPAKSTRGLITTLAASLENEQQQYALEGSVFVTGAAVQWLRDEMGLISSAAESETLALSVPDTNGVYFVPAFVGLGAPHWDSQARGLITGISRGTTRAHIVRATLEAIAYRVHDVLNAMTADIGDCLKCLKVDGGASANEFLMQFQSDILAAEVIRPEEVETTALGAAYLAGLTCGFFKNKDALKSNNRSFTSFTPSISESKRRALLLGWHKAVNKTKEQ